MATLVSLIVCAVCLLLIGSLLEKAAQFVLVYHDYQTYISLHSYFNQLLTFSSSDAHPLCLSHTTLTGTPTNAHSPSTLARCSSPSTSGSLMYSNSSDPSTSLSSSSSSSSRQQQPPTASASRKTVAKKRLRLLSA